MKERPILFTAQMVQAILDGRKTMTRRIIKPQPDDDGLWDDDKFPRSIDSRLKNWNGQTAEGLSREWKCPYGKPGDRLWVKETWRPKRHSFLTGYPYEYKTTAKEDGVPLDEPWNSSLFMPKGAARIWLEIISIKVERLQDITDFDAQKEGYGFETDFHATDWFLQIWEGIHGVGSWDINPFVWVIEFKVIYI